MIRQEIINLLYTAIELAGDGGLNPFTETELAAMNTFLNNTGWHPASELPVIPEGESTMQVIAMWKFSSMPIKALCGKHGWVTEGVKWWCYPPKEE